MNSYLFYDLETSGLNKAFDQIIQFAAIRTDMQLNEIERHNFLVKLRPDIALSPQSLITHRIPISETMTGICEYEAAKKIHRLMNEPGTISLGYNTLGFDDEFLRFTFHRNLLPPYTHQYSHGCRRMDLFPITIMYKLYKKNVLAWPTRDGKPSLKLENLNAENDLASGNAHDALVDVEATLALAHHFMNETDMWNYLAGNFVKEVDRQRAASLPVSFQNDHFKHTQGILISSEFGADMQFQVPVLFIGDSIPYSNQSLWLRMDLPELRKTTMDTIQETTWVIRKRFGEPGILLPPHKRYVNFMGDNRMLEYKKNSDWIQTNLNLFNTIIKYHRTFRYPEIPNLDADAALYQMGFLTRKTEAICREFHLAALADKIKLISQFQTTETKILATRVIARNFPEALPKNLEKQFIEYLSKVNPQYQENALADYKGKARTTPVGALADIREMKKNEALENAQLKLLDELEIYLIKTFHQN